jgi:hypothetical protein
MGVGVALAAALFEWPDRIDALVAVAGLGSGGALVYAALVLAARLPEAAGAPHFWVVSGTGQVLASENTLPLENGDKSYDPAKFRAFVDRWRSHSVH